MHLRKQKRRTKLAEQIRFTNDLDKLSEMWREYFSISIKLMGMKDNNGMLWNWNNDGTGWRALRIENTMFATYKTEGLKVTFRNMVAIIDENMSIDGLLRAHWLYWQMIMSKD